MTQTNTLTDFDKLRNLHFDEEEFQFSCPYCKNKEISLIPFNISWKTNSNNSDLPPKLKRGYDSLPTKMEAVLLGAQQHDVFFECENCQKREFICNYIDRLKLIKWLQSKQRSKN